jgi:hypothetical protein
MLDPETFLTELYVEVDEWCKAQPPPTSHPGHAASLSRSEVITLAIFAQWGRFESEASFYRYARQKLGRAFPTLPSRPQLNRLVRCHRDAIARFALWLGERLGSRGALYEVLDSTGVRTRNLGRRGRGWLAGLTDKGWCTRLGWYHGFHLLLAVGPTGVITGFGFGPASSNDRHLAETFFAARAAPDPGLASVGRPASGPYAADTGFAGRDCEARWAAAYGAQTLCPPQRGSKRYWPKPWRGWHATIRQVIEAVNDHLLGTFRLDQERPHDLTGFQARVAAKVALHNVCIWLNRKLGRPDLAFAEVLDWD